MHEGFRHSLQCLHTLTITYTFQRRSVLFVPPNYRHSIMLRKLSPRNLNWHSSKSNLLMISFILTEFLQYNSNKGMEDIKLEQLQHIDQLTGQLPQKCLFKFYGNCNTYVPTSDNLSQYIHQKQNTVQQIRGGLGLEKLMESNNFPWVNSPRRKRDYSMGMSEMCCNWGCTKTEIGRLC